jgi:hypothetical protein
MGLMVLILGATFWILRSPKKGTDANSDGDETTNTANEAKPKDK